MSESPHHDAAFEAYARDIGAGVLRYERHASSPALPAFQLSAMSAKAYLGQALATRRSNGAPYQYQLGYLERAQPNAFAAMRQGIHLIGIHAGLVTDLLDLAHFALALPTTFQHVGRATTEAGAGGLPQSSLAHWFGALEPATDLPWIPRDPERKAYAEDLAQLLLRFTWLHEHYHCVNGHVGYCHQIHQGMALHELPDPELPLVRRQAGGPLPAGTVQLLEYDADRTAIWAMFHIQSAEIENIPSIAARPLFERQLMTFFACAIMLVLFDRAASAQPASALQTHPVPYLRLHNLIRTAASNVTAELDDMRPLFLALVTELHALRTNLTALPDIAVLYNDLMSAEAQRPLDAMDDALEAFREKLMPFRYFVRN